MHNRLLYTEACALLREHVTNGVQALRYSETLIEFTIKNGEADRVPNEDIEAAVWQTIHNLVQGQQS